MSSEKSNARREPPALLLRVDAVSKQFPTAHGSLVVLNGVSLELAAEQAIAIMGPSGSGKSTLLSILGAMEPPSSGSVTLDEMNPFALSEPELARFRSRRIGFVFQNHYLLPQCSALENVLIPTLPLSYAEAHAERARLLLTRVGLEHRLDHRPGELSGGENQRVAVARALINSPALLLADEPTGNLDQCSADAVVELLLEVHREERAGLIMVTHSRTLAERFDRQYQLADGQLTAA